MGRCTCPRRARDVVRGGCDASCDVSSAFWPTEPPGTIFEGWHGSGRFQEGRQHSARVRLSRRAPALTGEITGKDDRQGVGVRQVELAQRDHQHIKAERIELLCELTACGAL